MTLTECEPGSLVVIREDGAPRMVELGALLGWNPKKRRGAWSALVHDVDDQSLTATGPRNARAMDPGAEVLSVIATAGHLRLLRQTGRRSLDTQGGDVDPMLARARGTF